MTRALPFLLGLDDLPLAELHAARLDGDLVAVAQLFAPTDVARSVDWRGARELRARALAPRVPRGLVVELRTAAWVHGAWPVPPLPIDVCVRSDHRVRAESTVLRSVRQAVLGAHDFDKIGDLLVTTPLRTALDLLRLPAVFDRRDARCVTTLLIMPSRDGPPGVSGCDAALRGSPHLPHKRRALERLARLPLAA
jgi:hypothetical protein